MQIPMQPQERAVLCALLQQHPVPIKHESLWDGLPVAGLPRTPALEGACLLVGRGLVRLRHGHLFLTRRAFACIDNLHAQGAIHVH